MAFERSRYRRSSFIFFTGYSMIAIGEWHSTLASAHNPESFVFLWCRSGIWLVDSDNGRAFKRSGFFQRGFVLHWTTKAKRNSRRSMVSRSILSHASTSTKYQVPNSILTIKVPSLYWNLFPSYGILVYITKNISKGSSAKTNHFHDSSQNP